MPTPSSAPRAIDASHSVSKVAIVTNGSSSRMNSLYQLHSQRVLAGSGFITSNAGGADFSLPSASLLTGDRFLLDHPIRMIPLSHHLCAHQQIARNVLAELAEPHIRATERQSIDAILSVDDAPERGQVAVHFRMRHQFDEKLTP